MKLEAATKDTLELQGCKESEVNKTNTENERVHKVKPKPVITVIDAMALHMNHPSVTSRILLKHERNVENWATSNEFAALEEIRILPDEERMMNPTCILLRWVMNVMTTA